MWKPSRVRKTSTENPEPQREKPFQVPLKHVVRLQLPTPSQTSTLRFATFEAGCTHCLGKMIQVNCKTFNHRGSFNLDHFVRTGFKQS